MKLHRFYIPKEACLEDAHLGKDSVLTIHLPEFVHQINKVLRLQIGEKFAFFSGDSNEYVSSIVSYEGKSKVVLKIEEIKKNDVSFKKEIYLFFSIIKRDNVDWILEKGTEVGVSHFIPILSARSEKKDINMERAQKIITEASEQCGRNTLPILHHVTKLENVFNEFTLPFVVLEKNYSVLNTENIKDKSIGLLIGPEGGWTPEEIKMFENKKAIFQSLGPTTLRAETAAIVSSSRMFF